ncbi:MBL fold metallo-hydrolase [Vallitalea okinawensis]|uniref:MBL fold metallo-hydrolase n=1 Tax=Vallitalea okinawensis TaxID=2078660 RepID=UPI000CFC653F|nr:MBL fold metallo-hydrolase [Vallitalea okinawensis]
MKFTILGSGGAIRIPRACCDCSICNEARQKGYPYKRLGQSLFLHDENILFDTPEDINEELNDHEIKEVDHIFYTHWHPDHTLGCRIIESLMDGVENKKPIDVHMPEESIEIVINKSNSIFDFYHSINFCNVISSDREVNINSISIKKIKLLNDFAYAYLINENNKRVLYCPCHGMHLPYMDELYKVDLLIIGKGYSKYTNVEWTNFERDTLRIIKDLKPKKVILTHIEESDGLGYDDYVAIEKEYDHIQFGYDGQIIKV